ncbi:MAG: type II/IV secretion system ATPase subunit [Candidatus Aenigmarchaeota archaeon]|nr:type II/IV secretion system ATPase subunit [Candidatus Aenigmarchaeota archaeon]
MLNVTSLRGALRRKLSKNDQKTTVYDSVYTIFTKRQRNPPVITTLSDHLHEINVRYPLIDPFLYANIVWDPEKSELVYKVIEPYITDDDKKLIETITQDLMELLEVELSSITKRTEAVKYLEEHVKRIINEAGINVPRHKYGKLFYYIYRNFIGLNDIEPLMSDPRIEDIGCDGVGVPIYIVHRVYGSVKTNIKFDSPEVLRNLVVKIAERCGRYISYAEPILDGSLPDGSRAHASLSSDVTTHGPTFSIRKFREDPFSPVDIIGVGTASAELLSYMWTAVEHGSSILLCGGVATGKTSLLNCLSMFIKPEQKIVSIEDTRELSLPHENWIPSVSRAGFGIPNASGEKYGEVSLFDLLKGSFRENPDYVIVGEVRGKEAYVMFQGMASGHPSMTTMHADSIEGVIRRLITPPIELPPSLIESLDMVVVLSHAREIGKSARRITEIDEIESMDPVTGKVHHVKSYVWDPITDTYQKKEDSVLFRRIASKMGIEFDAIMAETKRKELIINWMIGKKVTKFEDVANIVSLYYKDNHTLMDWVDKQLEPFSTISKEDIKRMKTSASGMRILGEK